MASLQASIQFGSLSSSSSSSSKRTKFLVSVSNLKDIQILFQKKPFRPQRLVKKQSFIGSNAVLPKTTLLTNGAAGEDKRNLSVPVQRSKLYAILEEVVDRIEMHRNLEEQRNNWNTHMLNSINLITLTAALMAGFARTNGGISFLPLKLSSSVLLFSAAGMVIFMNKIQPSQLAEEHRNATRLFTKLKRTIETKIVVGEEEEEEEDARDTMERVLALDRAYPLPLLGTTLEILPKEFKPTKWWPNHFRAKRERQKEKEDLGNGNGWSKELEMKMRDVFQVVKMKDMEEYKRLGNIVLTLHKALAFLGPVLTGISATSSVFTGSFSWATGLTVVSASLAAVVNTLEHGGQVGMVLEMYRNAAGFFNCLGDSIEGMMRQSDAEKRENGEMFEMKVALKLGRSLSELGDLATKSSLSRVNGTPIDEFASKLF